MRTIKTISATVKARFERMVEDMEDHEAILNSMIKEARGHLLHGKTRLNRIRSQINSMTNRKAELQAQTSQWERRARTIGTEDRDKAMECLKRLEWVESELNRTRDAHRKLTAKERGLSEDMDRIEEKIKNLKIRKLEYSIRESKAKATKILTQDGGCVATELDEAFERWEDSIFRLEQNCTESTEMVDFDQFEAEFLEKESKEKLESRLEDLLSSTAEARSKEIK